MQLVAKPESAVAPSRPPNRLVRGRRCPALSRFAVAHGFVLTHVWLPLAVLTVTGLGLACAGGDLWLADRLYAWEGNHWALRHEWWSERLLHLAGRDASLLAWCGVLVAWVVAGRSERLRRWRHPLAYLLATVAVSTSLVAWIKVFSNMDCPWDLTRYGGSKPYVDLFSLRPVGLRRGHCFPAGHASAGYAWMSLYFVSLWVRPGLRWWGLAIGVVAGLVFGFDQELRGAHFLSHDVWAAGVCWTVACAGFVLVRSATGREERS